MCKNEILAKLASNEIDVEAASKALAELETPQGTLRCKVSEKKAVSLYGVNSRMPVTLYADQWIRVLDFAEEIRKFIKDRKSELSFKAAK